MDVLIGIWTLGTHGQCCSVEVTSCSQSFVISRERVHGQPQIGGNGTHGGSGVLHSVLVLTFLESVGDISAACAGNLDLALSAHTSLPRLHPALEQIQVLKDTSLGLNKKIF